MKLYNNDAELVLAELDTESIDLVVTSPPYDNLRTYKGAGDSWSFDKFKKIANQLVRVIKRGGVIVWIVNDAVVDGSETGTSFRQALYFKEKGLNLHDTMIWSKTNPMPQVIQPRYNQVFEYMFILSKGKPKAFTPIMIPCKCAGISYDSTCKNMGGENGRTKKSLIINKEKVKANIWEIAIAQNNKTGHPAVFPERLVTDHIRSWSNEGDVVLDPFMGSGTTGIAAAKLGRDFIGIEMVNDYFNIAEKRIQEAGREQYLFYM